MFNENVTGNQVFAPLTISSVPASSTSGCPPGKTWICSSASCTRWSGVFGRSADLCFDDSDRSDRISKQEPRIRAALEIVRAKHPDLEKRLLLGLYMQMFSGFYDIEPT